VLIIECKKCGYRVATPAQLIGTSVSLVLDELMEA
jgi:hypothetical protein